MTPLTYFCIGLAVVILASGLAWRLTSRRQELPCPVWLRWLVEMDNPFTQISRDPQNDAAFSAVQLSFCSGHSRGLS